MSHSVLKFFGGVRWLLMPALLCCVLSRQAYAQNDNANAPMPAPAQAEQPRPGDSDFQMLPALNLTDEQRTQLVAIAQQHQQDLAAAQIRLRQARRALNQAIYSENPEQSIVNERARDVATAQESVIRLNAQTEFKVRQVLTPEQLKRFRQLRRRQREERLGNPAGEQRRLPRERFPNPNRPSDTQPSGGNNNSTPAEVLRERRRLRRQLPNTGRRP